VNRWYLTAIFVLFALIAGLVAADIYHIRSEIARNRAVLDRLSNEHTAAEQRMKELEERIERLRNGHRSVETMAFTKYRMLRPDQYILHDTAD